MKEVLKGESLDKVADEIADLLLNSRNLSETLSLVRQKDSEIARLQSRIDSLESRLNNLIKNFEINLVESERLSTEKFEEVEEETQKTVVNLENEIQKLNERIEKILKILQKKKV